ncbi:hypothetical protein VST63_22345 [Mycolicibacterium sp. 050232]|uniref:hypothetical protein n=1 Tax=Mycolicibacterium sp. 050232 TaxID=3113982 RepID=UPI002E2DD588|nr:hypothetical protein [Mycolicibacterium sp. 050232]MED5815110.1 hypothetical protein [Mycolicibacterium sp. 050232]
MADREAAGPQVLMLGWLTDLSGSVTTSLRRAEIPVKHAHPPCAQVPIRTRWRTTDSAAPPLSATEIDSIESVITVFDGHWVRARFGGRRTFAWRRRLRACANEACESATTTALTVGARRVLLICDARRLPPGRRAIALRWTRNLAHRISYECLVNGLPGHAAAYAVIDTDDDVREVAAAVVPWHAGHDTNRQRWPLHPVVRGSGVTPASSAPHRTPRS